MPNYEPRWICETQPADEDLRIFTPASVPEGPYNYDDGSLGCEAMIGQLSAGINGCWSG